MEATALAVVEPQEAVSLLESPLSPAETAHSWFPMQPAQRLKLCLLKMQASPNQQLQFS